MIARGSAAHIVATALSATASAETRAQTIPATRFSICRGGGGADCVVDGDTVWIAGFKYRVADIDAPECIRPGAGVKLYSVIARQGGWLNCCPTVSSEWSG